MGSTQVTVSIVTATPIPAKGSYGGSVPDAGYPADIDMLPEVCAVQIRVVDSTDTTADPPLPVSKFDFGMFLPPVSAWNYRFLAVGGESFARGVNWWEMSQGPHYGFATISTSNGENPSPGYDSSWAKDTGAVLDWGYRAMHGSVVLGKMFTEQYYGVAPVFSYYSGCSTGGRQGLREIVYDANAFDGVLVGAPAWDTVHLDPWVTKLASTLAIADGAPTSDQLSRIAAEAVKQCDELDHVKDNIISDPDACLAKFDITAAVCKTGENAKQCLSLKQATALSSFYQDYTVSGKLVSHGYDVGSEDGWATYFNDSFAAVRLRRVVRSQLPGHRHHRRAKLRRGSP